MLPSFLGLPNDRFMCFSAAESHLPIEPPKPNLGLFNGDLYYAKVVQCRMAWTTWTGLIFSCEKVVKNCNQNRTGGFLAQI
jgi:hypothetical protein